MLTHSFVGWGGWGPSVLCHHNHVAQVPSLKLNNSKLILELDSTVTLVIESEYVETPVWKSSNEKVALVDQNGGVTIVGYGTAVITVTSGESKGTCTITVPKPQEKPEEPEEPTSKLDKTKLYSGYIPVGDWIRMVDIPEQMHVAKKKDIVGNLIEFDCPDVPDMYANGLKIGDFYMYGELNIGGDVDLTINII